MEAITLSWIGGEHPFCLPLGGIRAVQERCDAGPEQLLQRMSLGHWRVDELVEIIRQGLIGGGMPMPDATRLVADMAELHPLIELKMPAFEVLRHALTGPADDKPGKDQGGAQVPESPPENGNSATSTPTEQ